MKTTGLSVSGAFSPNRILTRGMVCLALWMAGMAWPGFAPNAWGVSPPPDGGYANANTAEGEDALFSLTASGDSNTAIGYRALFGNTSGDVNTAVGANALFANTTGRANTATGNSSLLNNGIGNENTANGSGALFNNFDGSRNTGVGFNVLSANSSGNDNTANGWEALFSNTTGIQNTATGVGTLHSNTTGEDNTAAGFHTLFSNTTGQLNTASGSLALLSNSTGSFNTGTGAQTLQANTTGSSNTATGYTALFSNTTGNSITAVGLTALGFNTTGSNNVAAGASALLSNSSGGNNVAIGVQALVGNTLGFDNIAIGYRAGANLESGRNNIALASEGAAGDTGVIRIGEAGIQSATYIAGIRGIPVSGAMPVGVDRNGKLGVKPSSRRFKEAIAPMKDASAAIFALQPVTFRYKAEIGSNEAPQFGLVAEEVEKVNPDLVVRDEDGRPFTVRYEAVNAMLLNEFLKAHEKAAQQEATITELRATVEDLSRAVAEQAAQWHKLSERGEPSRAPARLVANP